MMQVPNFSNINILVLGDVMLDRYWYGDTSRISPEAPVPVVRINKIEERPGGAANVALNLAALGVNTSLIGQVGDDPAGERLRQLLCEQAIRFDLQSMPGRETIAKLRVLSRHQQLIRLDFEQSVAYQADAAIKQRFAYWLTQADAVILSDYAKGTLHDVHSFIALAKSAGKIVVVDPKGLDFQRYRQATLVTPNQAEFEQIVGETTNDSDFAAKAQALREAMQWPALLVTRGAKGMSLFQSDSVYHLPAHAKEVFDVTGAGDTVVALLAAVAATGHSLRDAVRLANVGAAIVVAKLGAAQVSVAELEMRVHDLAYPNATGVLDEEQVFAQIRATKSCGEKVVMTNGCFDILHAGHIDFLQRAKQCGDRLLVAINEDASVEKLKGIGRPVVPLVQRMQVLAALACVDWVVPFSEPTPERLICALLPDVLVKGADYKVEQIAGQACVKANGGQVLTLSLQKGCSTTAIIDKIRKN